MSKADVLKDSSLIRIATMVCKDWVKLLLKLNMSYRDVNIIESMYPTNIQNQALEGLERWRRRNMEGNVSIDDIIQNLITALEEVNRHDVTEIIDGIIAGDTGSEQKRKRRQIKTIYLDDLATQLIGDSVWTKVLYHLGLSYNDIQIIESMYPQNIQRQALEGLVRWKQKNSKKEDCDDMIDKIVTALHSVERQDIIDWIKDNLEKAEYQDSESVFLSERICLHKQEIGRVHYDIVQNEQQQDITTNQIINSLQRNVVGFTTDIINNIENIVTGISDYEQTGCEENDVNNVHTGRRQRNRRRLTLGIPCLLLLCGIIFLIIMIVTEQSETACVITTLTMSLTLHQDEGMTIGIVFAILLVAVFIVLFFILLKRKRDADRNYLKQIEDMRTAKQEAEIQIDSTKNQDIENPEVKRESMKDDSSDKSNINQNIEKPEIRESTAGDSSDKSCMNQTIGSPQEIRESTDGDSSEITNMNQNIEIPVPEEIKASADGDLSVKFNRNHNIEIPEEINESAKGDSSEITNMNPNIEIPEEIQDQTKVDSSGKDKNPVVANG